MNIQPAMYDLPRDRSARRRSRYDLVLGGRAGFYILLALSAEPMHAAEVDRQIIGDTMGTCIKQATLYNEIRRLVQAGLIEPMGNEWPQAWRLTNEGKRLLKLEIGTLKWVLEVAQRRGLC